MTPREHAIKALDAIINKDEKPKGAIDAASEALDTRDLAFEMELLYGTLRHLYTLDWAAGRFLKKPGRLHSYTLNNIRVALYQLLYMRVPDWAAVNEAVTIERRQKPLVNAVLRSAARELDSIGGELEAMRAALASETDAAKAATCIELLTSHPLWLVKRWVGRFGVAGALALADANNERPPLTIRVNSLRCTREAMIERLFNLGIEAVPTLYSSDGLTLRDEATMKTITGLMGDALVQDEAAQMVSLMLNARAGMRVLDACSAPGGKATHIAQIMGDQGEVVALDVDRGRMRKLKENVSALGLGSVTPVVADLMEYARGDESFDAILLDAPCSSLGVIRRNPDVRYRHDEAALKEFGARQLEMLRAVAGMLRPGGRLVYATCSTEPEEGEDVIASFMIDADGFSKEYTMRTYPHIQGADGFFAVALERKGAA